MIETEVSRDHIHYRKIYRLNQLIAAVSYARQYTSHRRNNSGKVMSRMNASDGESNAAASGLSPTSNG